MNLAKLAKWTLFYVLQWAVLYAAFWLRIDGALHIAIGQGSAACGASPAPTGCASSGTNNERTDK